MRAYHLDYLGSLDGMTLHEQDIPKAGPNEVLVKVRAASLNQRDLMIIAGTYPFPAKPGVIPVSDGAGEVVAVGDGVTRFAVGDRVCTTYLLGWLDGPLKTGFTGRQLGTSDDGILAEYSVLHEDWLVGIPDRLSFEEAATLPCAALTAWTAVGGPQPVKSGDTVLTLGTGGVALAALQLAVALGARVIAATSSANKAEMLEGLGAAKVLIYDPATDWHKEVREATGGQGVDHVMETIGASTLEQSVRALGLEGHLAMIGGFSGNTADVAGAKGLALTMDPRVFAGNAFLMRGVAVGHRTALEALCQFIDAHDLHPVIDSVHTFDNAPAAFKRLESGQHIGKVVISW